MTSPFPLREPKSIQLPCWKFGCGQIGVKTNGTAAKVLHFDRLGKKVHPGTFGNIKVG